MREERKGCVLPSIHLPGFKVKAAAAAARLLTEGVVGRSGSDNP